MIIINGIAGSGKTTQAELLAKRLGCPFFSVGAILREHGGPEIQRKMQAGLLVSPDEMTPILRLVLERFQADTKEVVTDGFPRDMAQAEWLVGEIEAGKIKFTALIHLALSETAAKDRLAKRNRADDTAAAIQKRFEEYYKEFHLIFDLFKAHQLKIIEVDGLGTVEAVAERVWQGLKDQAGAT